MNGAVPLFPLAWLFDVHNDFSFITFTLWRHTTFHSFKVYSKDIIKRNYSKDKHLLGSSHTHILSVIKRKT
jgi:hypothetical protein